MIEKDLDSSKVPYKKIKKPSNYDKKVKWDMAIGLQKVDDLTPSKYLKEKVSENITGELSLEEVRKSLQEHYIKQSKLEELDFDEYECDFVSTRIVELLEDDYFVLSVGYLKEIHKKLFQDVYEFAGKFREVDFSKNEKILNNDTVVYGEANLLSKSLEYDFLLERQKDYKKASIVDVINYITDFASSIWQVHPFREGNTRTTAVFVEKYLISMGFDIDNELFRTRSVYFRNALVRSNYYNKYLGISKDNSGLIKFFENLLLGKNNELNSENLIVESLFSRKK